MNTEMSVIDGRWSVSLVAALVLQLCVDAHYRWHEKCAGFPLRQSCRQCLDNLCEYTPPC